LLLEGNGFVTVGLTSIQARLIMNHNGFLGRAWEEHAVDLVAVWTLHEELLSLESVLEDLTCLVEACEEELSAVDATTLSVV